MRVNKKGKHTALGPAAFIEHVHDLFSVCHIHCRAKVAANFLITDPPLENRNLSVGDIFAVCGHREAPMNLYLELGVHVYYQRGHRAVLELNMNKNKNKNKKRGRKKRKEE